MLRFELPRAIIHRYSLQSPRNIILGQRRTCNIMPLCKWILMATQNRNAFVFDGQGEKCIQNVLDTAGRLAMRSTAKNFPSFVWGKIDFFFVSSLVITNWGNFREVDLHLRDGDGVWLNWCFRPLLIKCFINRWRVLSIIASSIMDQKWLCKAHDKAKVTYNQLIWASPSRSCPNFPNQSSHWKWTSQFESWKLSRISFCTLQLFALCWNYRPSAAPNPLTVVTRGNL